MLFSLHLNFAILKYTNFIAFIFSVFAFYQYSTAVYQAFGGKLNFHRYLISLFYPIHEIRKI